MGGHPWTQCADTVSQELHVLYACNIFRHGLTASFFQQRKCTTLGLTAQCQRPLYAVTFAKCSKVMILAQDAVYVEITHGSLPSNKDNLIC